ncbi:MAG: hypothetical protein WBQ26_10630 [Gemmatimonadaceae bacterium]|nr:hypothetical protein [Gemmatimonadaceae bacterium]
MRRFMLAIAILAIVPSLSVAQRGGGRSGGGRRTTDRFGSGEAATVPAISRQELADLDPLAILLDKRRDLKLTDDQTAKLEAMNGQLIDAQRPPFHALDSLNVELANLGSDLSSDDQAHARTLNVLSRMIASATRQRYDSVETVARALMTDDQKKAADDVLKDSHDRMERLVQRGRSTGNE